MIESTWQEEPNLRPSFSHIVQTISSSVQENHLYNVSPAKGTTDYVDVLAP